jgi:hypothetical protein
VTCWWPTNVATSLGDDPYAPSAGGDVADARRLTRLGWTYSLLLGALLSPTDPVLSSVYAWLIFAARASATR